MSELSRTVRTGERASVRIDTILTSVLLGELLAPSDDVWLVSPWISDVEILDNNRGSYDAIFGDVPPGTCRFSDTLARISAAGARVHVVTRPDPHNDDFVRRLHSEVPAGRVRVVRAPDVHEKTLCGGEWILSGSMNFTVRGMAVNEESITYKVGGPDAAQARLDLAQRWGDIG